MAIMVIFGSSSSEIYIYRQRFFFFLVYIHGFKTKTTKCGGYRHILMVLYNSSAINFCSFPMSDREIERER